MMRAVRLLPSLLRTTVASGWRHRVLGLSAEAAFWQLLSLPSLLLALIATFGYVSRLLGHSNVTRTESQLSNLFSKAFSPDVVRELIAPMLREVLQGQRADIISIGFVVALWAGSSAMSTFVNTITISYGMRDLRGPVKSRLLALWLSAGSILVGVVVLPMLVLGPSKITDLMPQRDRPRVSQLLHDSYYPILVLLLLIALTTLYHLAPPRRLPWHRGAPGACLAIVIFLAGSSALRAYIQFILDHNHAYGTLAAPVAALLFFYLLALGVLLGAEFNAAIEKQSPTPVRQPRILDPRQWRSVSDPAEDDSAAEVGGAPDGEPSDGEGQSRIES